MSQDFSNVCIVSDHDFYYNNGAFFVNRNENIHTAVAQSFSSIHYVGRVFSASSANFHRLPPNFKAIQLYKGQGIRKWLLQLPNILVKQLRMLKKADYILIKMFTLNSLIAAILCRLYHINYVSYLIGDPAAVYGRNGKVSPIRKLKSTILRRLTEFIIEGSGCLLYMSNVTRSNYRVPGKIPQLKYIESSFSKSHWIERDVSNKSIIRLLFVGRLIPIKGLESIFRVLKRLSQHSKQRIILDVVGTGAIEGKLKAECRALGIIDVVRFHGFVLHGPQLDKFYHDADILINNSLTEAFGLVLIEAAKLSLPVAASRVGGIPEVVNEGISGLLHSSEAELYENIVRLISDKGLYSKINRGAYEHSLSFDNQREANILVKTLRTYGNK